LKEENEALKKEIAALKQLEWGIDVFLASRSGLFLRGRSVICEDQSCLRAFQQK